MRTVKLREDVRLSGVFQVRREQQFLAREDRHVFDLSLGEPSQPAPVTAVLTAILSLAHDGSRYADIAGLPQLREALAAHYSRTDEASWTSENVVVTAGAKMALFEILLAAARRGAEVVIPQPAWVSYIPQCALAGARAVTVRTEACEGFRVTAAQIESVVTERTVAVIVNSPSNPTGAITDRGELKRIATLCADRGIFLICDEAYSSYVYDGAEFASGASLSSEFGDNIVVVGSFSKNFSMCGWRIGYIMGPTSLVDAVECIQSHTISCPTSFGMAGAVSALQCANLTKEAVRKTYQRRMAHVVQQLRSMPGVRCARPEGTFYAFPNVEGCYGNGMRDSDSFARWLLEESGVCVVAGSVFGCEHHVRISFGTEESVLFAGLARMKEALSRNH